MNNHKTLRIAIIAACVLVALITYAQGPPPPPPPPPPPDDGAPLGGEFLLLIAAAVAYGRKKLLGKDQTE